MEVVKSAWSVSSRRRAVARPCEGPGAVPFVRSGEAHRAFRWHRASVRSVILKVKGRFTGGRVRAESVEDADQQAEGWVAVSVVSPSGLSGPAEFAFVVMRVASSEVGDAQTRQLTKVCGVYLVTTEELLMVFKPAARFMCLFFYLCCVSKSHIYFPNMEQSYDCSSYKAKHMFLGDILCS